MPATVPLSGWTRGVDGCLRGGRVMTHYWYARTQLLAWIRDYGAEAPHLCIRDLQTVFAEVSELEEAFEKLQDDNRRLRSLLEHPTWQVIV